MKLTLPLPPSANLYWQLFHGKPVLTPDARRYKVMVKSMALAEGFCKPTLDEVVVSLTVYRKWRRGDLDNFQKVLFDSLNGVAWKDDSQIREIHARREEDPANPRVEVRVEAAE